MMALTQMTSLSVTNLHLLIQELGSAVTIYENRNDLRQVLPSASKKTLDGMGHFDTYLARAEQELEFCRKGRIQCLGLNDEGYPQRLRDCNDAPILLYYRGTANLNTQHIVSMVGTRQITAYGKDLCRSFVRDLKRLCPDALVVSGLAYGVDVHCHRAALDEGLETVGVLAHGLDQIYPRHHRETAQQMVAQGGLLTEYMSATPIDKRNFVQRNRIVAGMADAVVVVESATKGGSLITAHLAQDYNRDIFAFPGRTADPYSAGCNALIRDNVASLITSAEDFALAMRWAVPAASPQREVLQRDLFPELSPEEQLIVACLKDVDRKTISQITSEASLPFNHVNVLLTGLELKGIVRALPGGLFRLLQ